MIKDLQKAKGKSLSAHFKKMAGHYEKKADHHEKKAADHKAMADHHDDMKDKSDDGVQKSHHKEKASFHKAQHGHHDKLHKLYKATAEHHHAMASAHDDNDADDAKKVAAFKALEIDVEVEAAAPSVQAPTGDDKVNKTVESQTAAAVAAAVAATTPTPAPAASAAVTAPAVPAAGSPTDFADFYSKALEKGLKDALEKGLERLTASPEFGAIVQEKVAKMMLEKLGAAEPAKTFAVPRTPNPIDVQKTIASSGATPVVPSAAAVDPELADLVSMGN